MLIFSQFSYAQEKRDVTIDLSVSRIDREDLREFLGDGWKIEDGGKKITFIHEDGRIHSYSLTEGARIKSVIANQSRGQIVLYERLENSRIGAPGIIHYISGNQKTNSVGTDKFGNRKGWISRLESVSESGRFVIAFASEFHELDNGKMAQSSSWLVLDLFDSLSIVGRGLDSWVDFQAK